MSTSPIDPQDQSILKNLSTLEEAGEQGFSAYSAGDIQNGGQQIKQCLHDSAKNIHAIHDPRLREQTKALLDTAKAAIQTYLRNPSQNNLDVLKTNIITYKEFLDSHQ